MPPVVQEKRHSRPQPRGTIEYQVTCSDTLESIAAQFDTTPSELAKLNKMPSRMIYPGQVLFIPDKDYVPSGSISPDSASPPATVSESQEKHDVPVVRMAEKPARRGPGHAERLTSPVISPVVTDTKARSMSIDDAKQLDQECYERFIKTHVKHITDGQGVVNGVLLVTPNAVMFDPNVSDPLVIEHGAEAYGMITPLDMVISAALYHDIAAMRLRGQKDDPPLTPRPEVYHAKDCPMFHRPSTRHQEVIYQGTMDLDDIENDAETSPESTPIAHDPSNVSPQSDRDSVCSCSGVKSVQQELDSITENVFIGGDNLNETFPISKQDSSDRVSPNISGTLENKTEKHPDDQSEDSTSGKPLVNSKAECVSKQEESVKVDNSCLEVEYDSGLDNVSMETTIHGVKGGQTDECNMTVDSKDRGVLSSPDVDGALGSKDRGVLSSPDVDGALGSNDRGVLSSPDVDSALGSKDRGVLSSPDANRQPTATKDDVASVTSKLVTDDLVNICDDKFEHFSSESEAGRRESEAGWHESEVGRRESEAGRHESEAGRRESEAGRRESEAGWRESEVGRRESEAGRHESEAGRRESEAGRRESEAGWRESEVGRRDSEVGRRESEAGRRESEAERHESEAGWRESEAGWRESEAGWRESEAGRPENLRTTEMKIGNITYVPYDSVKRPSTDTLRASEQCDPEPNPASSKTEEASGLGSQLIGSLESSSHLIGSLGSKASPHISAFVNYATGLFRNTVDDRTNVQDLSYGQTPIETNLEKPKGNSEPTVSVRSAVTLADKPDLFLEIDKLVPRPAARYEDPPLYLCLRIGIPLNKNVSQTCPMEAYSRKRRKPEYWFSIPRDKVDTLYAFFVQWSPEIYGGEEEVDAETRGFVVIQEDAETPDDQLDVFTKHFGSQMSIHKDWEVDQSWEIVSQSEAVRRRSIINEDMLPLPELIGQSAILTDDIVRQLCKQLPGRAVGYPWNLVYSTDQHGFSLTTLYRKMKDSGTDGPILIVVKDTKNRMFGALTSCPLKMSDHFYGTGESFLFTFHPEFKVFRWTGENNFFNKGYKESMTIGSGHGVFGLWMDGDIYHGRSNHCDTYDNDILPGEEDFVVKGLEAWSFE